MKTIRDSDAISALLRSDFRSFMVFAFRELNGGRRPSDNWHIEVMADRVTRIAAGDLSRLLVNAPPRSLKSFICSIALPAFMLGRDPRKKILLAVGNPPLGAELMGQLARLMSAPRYRSLFPKVDFDRTKTEISLSSGGSIRLIHVGRQISGVGADLIIVDDPLSPNSARDAARREAVNNWFEGDLLTRLNNKRASPVLVVMQRVHPEDLSDWILSRHDEFERLVFSAVATDDEEWTLSDGRILRRACHAPLDPQRESIEELTARLHELGSFQFNAQYLQGQYFPFTEEESKGHWLWEQLPPNATGAEGLVGGAYIIHHKHCIIHYVFGVPYEGPILGRYEPVYNAEQQKVFEEKWIEYGRFISRNPSAEEWAEHHRLNPPGERREYYIARI